jgi:hypothetical protein
LSVFRGSNTTTTPKGRNAFTVSIWHPKQVRKTSLNRAYIVVSSLEINQQQAVGIKENNLIYGELVNK